MVHVHGPLNKHERRNIFLSKTDLYKTKKNTFRYDDETQTGLN